MFSEFREPKIEFFLNIFQFRFPSVDLFFSSKKINARKEDHIRS
ncbi:hypothetical protein LEP1GSC036_3033 [Leptospira weilii str. 2006001853]|nr:hypothetical protein LEP1GSC036_3033 [Leptospira weilii str. 2006001853]EMN43173.1 hypothetical protein LEP1GSC086_0470 [Leptospira weilii str. LNT 1234]EMN88938.1 hypothetical protein LEP1GSC108_1927 [Leptospira weilii str. UI 13098]